MRAGNGAIQEASSSVIVARGKQAIERLVAPYDGLFKGRSLDGRPGQGI